MTNGSSPYIETWQAQHRRRARWLALAALIALCLLFLFLCRNRPAGAPEPRRQPDVIHMDAATAARIQQAEAAARKAGEKLPPAAAPAPAARETPLSAPPGAPVENAPPPASAAAAGSAPLSGGYPREQGLAAYEAVVRELTLKADRIDELWKKYDGYCRRVIHGAIVFRRNWFSVYSLGIDLAESATPECRMIRDEISELAGIIDSGMNDAWERAHRAGVYPGWIRTVNEKYRMDLERWNRE
jgi:hypothetical protein